MEWNLAEGSAKFSIPVFSIPVEFRWIPEFTPECSAEWCSAEWTGILFPGMGRNGISRFVWYIIVYLFVTDNKQGLFGKHVYQTSPLSSSHHHHHPVRHHRPRSSSPPTVIVHDGLNPAHTGFHHPPRPPTLDNDTRASTSPDQNGNHRLVDCDTPPIRLGSTSAPQRSAATPEHPRHQNGNQLLSTMTPAHSFGLTLHPNARQPP